MDLRILLVEDELTDALMCRRAVARQPVYLEVVMSVAEAQVALHRGHFDCIWSDLCLGRASGIDLIEWLQSHRIPTPVIILTSMDDAQSGIEAVQAGAQDYVIKGSYDGPSLVAKTRYAIERARKLHRVRVREEQRRVASLSAFIAGAAHAIQNPLTALLTNEAVLADAFGGPGADPLMAEIVAENQAAARRLARILDGMRFLGSPQSASPAFEVGEVVRAVQREFPGARAVLDGESEVEPVPAPFRTMLVALLENATAVADEVLVRTHRADGMVEVTVEDDGPGVPEALGDAVFLPFVSGDAKGAGIGLAVAAEACRRLGGSLTLDSRAAPTRFVARFPASSAGRRDRVGHDQVVDEGDLPGLDDGVGVLPKERLRPRHVAP